MRVLGLCAALVLTGCIEFPDTDPAPDTAAPDDPGGSDVVVDSRGEPDVVTDTTEDVAADVPDDADETDADASRAEDADGPSPAVACEDGAWLTEDWSVEHGWVPEGFPLSLEGSPLVFGTKSADDVSVLSLAAAEFEPPWALRVTLTVKAIDPGALIRVGAIGAGEPTGIEIDASGVYVVDGGQRAGPIQPLSTSAVELHLVAGTDHTTLTVRDSEGKALGTDAVVAKKVPRTALEVRFDGGEVTLELAEILACPEGTAPCADSGPGKCPADEECTQHYCNPMWTCEQVEAPGCGPAVVCGDVECPLLPDYQAACNDANHCQYEKTDSDDDWESFVQWIWVPPGSFQRGATEADGAWAQPSEQPAHDVVHVDGFFLSRWEVTVEVYEACEDAKKCDPPFTLFDAWGLNTSADRPKHPQNGLDRARAEQVCAFLGGKPVNEAQFEYASNGAGAHTQFVGGIDEPPSCDNGRAWVQNGDGAGCGTDGTNEVGLTPDPLNPVGAEDLIGNVREWMADCGHGNYGTSVLAIDAPVDGSAWLDDECVGGVVRGGGYDADPDQPVEVRNASRSLVLTDAIGSNLGARCALEVKKQCAGETEPVPCDDGSMCTTDDQCDGEGGCTGAEIPCNDGEPCTANRCVPWKGCDFSWSSATAVIGRTAGDKELYLLTLQTGELEPLTDNALSSDAGARDHANEQLAFSRNVGGKWELMIKPLDGDDTTVEALTDEDYTGLSRPEWDGNDAGILYVATTGSADSDIYYLKLADKQITAITTIPGGNGQTGTAKGPVLAHVRDPLLGTLYFALNGQTWKTQYLGPEEHDISDASPLSLWRDGTNHVDVSPDGGTLIFYANHGGRRVYKVGTNDNEAAPIALTEISDSVTFPRFLPDGTFLYMMDDGDAVSIYQSTVSTALDDDTLIVEGSSQVSALKIWDTRCE